MSPYSFYDYPKYRLIEDVSISIDHNLDKDKKVMVLCKKKDLNGPNHELLLKILQAIGHTPESTQIIGVDDHEKINVTLLLSNVQPETLLSFEINLNKNGLNLEQKLYRLIKLMDTTIIISEALSTLQGKKEAKVKLWGALQEHFQNQK